MQITVTPPGRLVCAGRSFRCALGRGGIVLDKAEGDGGTPAGAWPLRRVLYRPDRLDCPDTGLPTEGIAADQGWCDDPAHPDYNRLIRLPFPAGYEKLWRGDAVYDVIVVLGHNDDPPVPGKGSAIFMHVARPDFSPTEGCVALALQDLLAVLAGCGLGDTILVNPADMAPVPRK
jgi:L,D-peptidoglycan transpeptidase YkuD (ErfK/YbiS/YcfS/YnhG family)